MFVLRSIFVVLSIAGAVPAQRIEPRLLKKIPLSPISPGEKGDNRLTNLSLLKNAPNFKKERQDNEGGGKKEGGVGAAPLPNLIPKIIGGQLVQSGEYPWFVLLLDTVVGSVCGGFLVAPQYLLTAAHCMIDTAPTALIGAVCLDFYEGSDGNTYWPNCGQDWEISEITDVFRHPDYDENTYDNDFAMLKLATRSAINPVKIDNGSYSPKYTSAKDNLWAIGFGRTDGDDPDSLPTQLNHVELGYVAPDDCIVDYQLITTITDDMMCATDPGQASCQGDSGGPLYDSENDAVVGIVSFGIEGCVSPDYPDVYFRIASQFAAIQATICSDDQQASICSLTTPTPTRAPTPRITRRPTNEPTPRLTRRPTGVPTPSPTRRATSPPTTAPTPPVCGDGEASFEVDVTLDAYPGDTSWNLKDACSGELIFERSYDDFDGTSDLYSTCISKGRYIFVLSDSFGDGIDSPGEVKVNYDGGEYELIVNGDFGSSANVTFGETCSRETSTPTTSAPTPRLTRRPSSPPTTRLTRRPTSAPTPRLTRRPTSAPTPRITRRPSSAPTPRITRRPSSAPTPRLTRRPTGVPTPSPTRRATSPPTTAPTPPVCGDGEASFEVDVTLDAYPGDTSWNLTDACSGELILERSYDDFDGTSDLYSTCISKGRYIFVLSDSFGDGFGSPGEVKVNYDGGEYELIVNGDFGSSANVTFGETCDRPTMPPSPPAGISCDNEREMKVLVIVRTDDFPDETKWAISDATGREFARNDSLFRANEVHNQVVCLRKICGTEGDYTFIIKDSYGDGISNMGYFKVLVDGTRIDDLDDALNFSERSFRINGCPSATPPYPCADGKVEVTVELKTDNYHTETSFEIRQARSESIVVPPTKPRQPQRIMKETYCLEKVDNYLFHIHDSGGDGLKDVGRNWDLSGHFKLFVDGEVVRGDSDGTDFGFNDTVVINARG